MWALSLALFGVAVWAWPDVPDQIPLHFGPDGQPGRWGERSWTAWMTLPLLGLALAAVLEGAATWARRHPEAPALNLPNKRALMNLPVDRRRPVLERLSELLYATGGLSAGALMAMQVGSWVSASGRDGSGWVLAGGLSLVIGSLAVMVWGMVRVEGEIRRQQGVLEAAA